MTARRLPRFARPRKVDGPFGDLDYSLLVRLRERDRRCCPCRALDHGPNGCAFCWPPCKVTGDEHPERDAAEHLEAWLGRAIEAGHPLALWIDGWRREDPPADQARPAPVAGELG